MAKEYTIIFCENRPKINQEQIISFQTALDEYITKKQPSYVNVSSYNQNTNSFSFTLALTHDNDWKIHVIGKEIVIDSPQIIDSTFYIEKFQSFSSNVLFVVDMCLDTKDIDRTTGEALGTYLKQTRNLEILLTTGNPNICTNNLSETWFVNRATLASDDHMNNSHHASLPNWYNTELNNIIKSYDDNNQSRPICTQLLRDFLCSGFTNKQYFGVVLLKLFDLLRVKTKE